MEGYGDPIGRTKVGEPKGTIRRKQADITVKGDYSVFDATINALAGCGFDIDVEPVNYNEYVDEFKIKVFSK